jgi:cell division protein ZapA
VSAEKTQVAVVLLNKEYRIFCGEDERSAVMDSADFLNARMLELQDLHKVARPERLALMVALNLSNELLRRNGKSNGTGQDLVERIRALRMTVDDALDNQISP